MALSKHYSPQEAEPRLMQAWQEQGVYQFDVSSDRPVYSVDTPPPTVSGHLHLGHVYSYSHTDFLARFWRMHGYNVFYPMGFDDNGLPTERLVEKRLKIRALDIGRQAFIEKCLQVSAEAEKDYEALWKRLGLSIDWRYTYRTIDERSRRICQLSFIDLYKKGLAYRRESPAIWCPECGTSIAQAELNDLERASEFVTLDFKLERDQPADSLPIATTRPELLPACVAVFVHPGDARYAGLIGSQAIVPHFGQQVPVMADPGADPEKGTGAVMCCTFGDTADVAWWYTHHLPLIELVTSDGRLSPVGGAFAGLTLGEARKQITATLEEQGLILGRQPTTQSVRVHERCDTPVEYVVMRQWFVKVLEHKEALLRSGEQIHWHPAHMLSRYQAWVENLNWDWCLSRQRYYGVPFPVWYCKGCGEVVLADEADLPVEPTTQEPRQPCPRCGSGEFTPETDIFDTWATSSMSPQIAGRWLERDPDPLGGGLYDKVFPYSLRPQAHEIIRTWAFYTITKSMHHFSARPWKDVAISGWGLAGEGMGKISKSRGGGPMPPMEMIERYSSDALRYWAASTGPGKDAIISEEKIQMGSRLVTKLWNVARFAERFLWLEPTRPPGLQEALSPADRWVLARLQRLVRRATDLLLDYDYAAAKVETEAFFWRDMADNYLEMAKQRLYEATVSKEGEASQAAARWTLTMLLKNVLQLFAPFLPYITEEIYLGLFAKDGESIHQSAWPEADASLEDAAAEALGETLVAIATAVRRYKSERSLPLGQELALLQLVFEGEPGSAPGLDPDQFQRSIPDLKSITRAVEIRLAERMEPGLETVQSEQVTLGIAA